MPVRTASLRETATATGHRKRQLRRVLLQSRQDQQQLSRKRWPRPRLRSIAYLGGFAQWTARLGHRQKSGVVHALDPDQEGKILWQTRVDKWRCAGRLQPAALGTAFALRSVFQIRSKQCDTGNLANLDAALRGRATRPDRAAPDVRRCWPNVGLCRRDGIPRRVRAAYQRPGAGA